MKFKEPVHDWGGEYNSNIAVYSLARAKRAQFIREYLSRSAINDVASFLELAAFSAKDSIKLKECYPCAEVYASDYEFSVLRSDNGVGSFAADAFGLPLADNAVECTFHSGLIVLYDKKRGIDIIKEQLRVTSRVAFVFVQNRGNWLDRLSSFVKRRFMGKSIFSFRYISESELEVAGRLSGCLYEIHYYDNMIFNFFHRISPLLSRYVKRSYFFECNFLCNEIVLVLKCDK